MQLNNLVVSFILLWITHPHKILLHNYPTPLNGENCLESHLAVVILYIVIALDFSILIEDLLHFSYVFRI